VFQLAPGDDAMLSHTYSLLNYISATSRFSGLDDIAEIVEGTGGQTDYATLHSVESALRGLTEEEKRLIAVSTISVASRLAVEFENDEVRSASTTTILLGYYIFPKVARLTVSMLLQHLRSAEPTVEAVIAFNLVDLALCAPENTFVDIIRAFSTVNRAANPDDPRLSNNMVCTPKDLRPSSNSGRALGSRCTD